MIFESRVEGTQMAQVLVTGGTGFIGSWCVLTLLDAGHTVRTTVRDLRREPALRSWLHAAIPFDHDRLTVVRADLEHAEGWDDAVTGSARRWLQYRRRLSTPMRAARSTAPAGSSA